jgi:rubrerythrin
VPRPHTEVIPDRKEGPVSPLGPVTNTPAAHLELVMMDSHIAGSPDEYFLDRFRRLGLLQAELLSGIAILLRETKVCGGKLIHLGKVLVEEWLQFIERTPELAVGLQLQAAIAVFAESTPFLAPLLAPLRAELDAQRFGEAFRGTGFVTHLSRQAAIYFRRTADVLNLTRNLLTETSGAALSESFETPDLFALDYSENPFDLDDLSDLSPLTRAAAKFLVVLGMAEGKFCEAEQAFLRRMLGDTGESLSESQFQKLVSEASRESLEQILAPVEHQSVIWKEKLLMSGMLMVAADGKVDVIEKKQLAQACLRLGISTTRYKQIAQDAISIIKSFRVAAAQESGRIERSAPGQTKLIPAVASWDATPVQRTAQITRVEKEELIEIQASPMEPPLAKTTVSPRQQPVAAMPQSEPAPRPKKPESKQAPSLPEQKSIWRCPACLMPQFQEFAECPQCGVIVEKFLAKMGVTSRFPPQEEPVESVSVERNAPEPVRAEITPTGAEPGRPKFCVNCGEPLEATYKFCISCGKRVEEEEQ